MPLALFRSLWTNGYDLDAALHDVRGNAFDGIEGPVPENENEAVEFAAKLRAQGCPFIAEIVTGGGYVPSERRADLHFEEFCRSVERAKRADPLFLTVLTGCDSWSVETSVDYFGRCLEAGRDLNLALSFETHRSRPTFNPWATQALLEQLPDLRLTCDFSHWCCVCERLVLDEEPAILDLCAARARHVHARVGYAQGPQAPHPAAPEYAPALAAHQRWWEAIWRAQKQRGLALLTMTPEFGPDGYLQRAPFTRAPAASLDEINGWMARSERKHFLDWENSACVSTP